MKAPITRLFWAVVFALAPERYETRTDGLWKYGVIYKAAFGKRKTILVFPLLPEHQNCRCVLCAPDLPNPE